MVAGQRGDLLIADQVAAGIPHLSHKEVGAEQRRRGGGGSHPVEGGIGLRLLVDDLVGILDGLAQEDHEVGLTDRSQGLEVVIQAFGNRDHRELAGHLPACLPPIPSATMKSDPSAPTSCSRTEADIPTSPVVRLQTTKLSSLFLRTRPISDIPQ